MDKNKRETGKDGEDVAIDFLRKHEYVFVQRNFETPYGEIDLIMMKDRDIYFFEVKYRKNLLFGFGDEAISRGKIEKLKKSIEVWISLNGKNFKYESIFLDGIVIDPNGEINRFEIL